MRVETLEAYNLPPEILSIWRERVGPELLPVQERAVKEYGLFGRENLIVFSPTSSGKTFVGEMAAVKAARENTKVFYLVPLKALAEEKAREFRDRYAKVGIKVVVSSRDHREHDEEIERREFQIAVVVFEKMQALLVSKPQLVEAVGLVVVDEMQLITDETRGPALELLLTKLRIARSQPRIVGLSAVLGRAQVLADWLRAKLLVDTHRPVELRKGVLC
jgi:helicase